MKQIKQAAWPRFKIRPVARQKLSTSDRFQLHDTESVSYPNRYIRFPLEDLGITDVILKLKVKRDRRIKDLKLCEIVFSAD